MALVDSREWLIDELARVFFRLGVQQVRIIAPRDPRNGVRPEAGGTLETIVMPRRCVRHVALLSDPLVEA